MFAKANLHANGVKLVNYILSAGRDDERVEFGGARGFDFFSDDPREAARLMQRMADATTRCEKPWFHTQTRLPADERLTPEQWEVVQLREEKRLGFSGLPCIWSFHVNEATGERHMHAVWFRVDVEQERAVDPGLFKLKLKQTCRSLEREFGLRELDNDRQPHDRARAADRNEVEESRRLGTDVRAIRNAILDCYQHADNGRAFRAAIEEKGFILANGDRRDCFVVIDQAEGQHALNKKLTGHTLEETRSRFSDLDRSRLPSVEQAQAMQRDRQAQRAIQEARTAARSAEPAAPVWDRDTAALKADERIIDAAIRTAPAATEARQRQEPEAGPEARGGATEPAHAPPQAARELSGTAADIRMAWSMSRTASELEDGLAASGITLAQVSATEAAASQRAAAFAKEVGNFAPRWREGEIVAVDGRGHVYRLDERTTGKSGFDVQGRLNGLDYAAMTDVTAAKEAMRAAGLEAWKEERRAVRERARTPNWVEQRIADSAYRTGIDGALVQVDAERQRVGRIEALADQFRPESERQTQAERIFGREAFAARLEEAGIAIVRVTQADTRALEALRQDEQQARLAAETNGEAYRGHHFAELLPGELAAVTRSGDVHRINLDKTGAARSYLPDVLPGVTETRARFEIEREKEGQLWTERRADIQASQQDYAAVQEQRASERAVAQDAHGLAATAETTIDTGMHAGEGVLRGLGKIFTSLIGWLADSIAPPPPPTRDQAARMARSAEERQEVRAEQEAEAQRDEQHWLIIEAQKAAREREEKESEQERAYRRERDRGYERER